MGYTSSPGAVISVSVDGVAASQRQIDSMARSMTNLSTTVQNAMRNVAATVGLGGGVMEVAQLSDQYTKLTSQLKLATGSAREYTAAYGEVKRIAAETQSELAGTGVLYARIANGTRELGLSQQRVAQITEVVNLALKVSGATAEEAASAQLQLSQAFASGTLRGEEFNAVNEAAPRLMKALADGLGVPVGMLKQMASEGKITSEVMADVLPRSLEHLRQEATQVQTIGGAFTVLKNNVLEFTATSAQSNGTVALMTGAIGLLSNNLTLLAGALTTVTAVKAGTWTQAWVTETYKKVAADQAARNATLASTQADLARVQAGSVLAASTQAAIVTAREETLARLAQANASITAARAAVQAATAAGAQSFALRTLRAATGELATAEVARAAALAELATLGQQQARVSAEIAAARLAEAAATKAANNAQAGASIAAGLAGRAVSFLGGPIGAIIALLGVGATAWSLWGSKAKESSAQAAESYEEAHQRIVKGLDEQIAKNERLLQLRALGATKAEAERSLPIINQLAAASQRLADINERRGEFARSGSKSETDVEFARMHVLRDIAELSEKMQKNNSTTAAAEASGTALTDLIAVRERLTGVDKQYLEDLTKLQTALEKGAISQKEYTALVSQLATEEYKKSESGKAALEATHKEAEAYATLISAVRAKADENRLELAVGQNVSASQKESIKLDQELASGKLKLAPAHLAVARAALAELAVTEQQLKQRDAQRELTKWIVASTDARNQAAAALDVEYALYGQSNDARDIAMVRVRAEADAQKKLDEMRSDGKPVSDQMIAQLKAETAARVSVEQATVAQGKALSYATQLAEENKRFGLDYIADERVRATAQLQIDAATWQERIRLAGEGTEAQKLLQEQYDTWYRNQLLKPQLDEQKRALQSIEQTAHDTFISIFDSGKSAFDRLRDTLKNGLLDLLYQMTLKRWIINIGASVGYGGSGLAQAAGMGGAQGGIPGLLNSAQSASSLYKMISGGAMDSMGSLIAGAGNMFGSSTMSAFGAGFAGNSAGTTMTAAEGFANAGMGAEASAASYGSMASSALGAIGGIAGGIYGGRAISGGYGSNGAVNTGTAIGAAVGSIVPVIGTAIGALVGGLLGGVYNRTFGHKAPEIESQGLKGTFSDGVVSGQSYQNIVEKGGWFSSTKRYPQTQEFTDDLSKRFTEGFTNIEKAAAGFGKALGVSADALANYSKAFDVKLTSDEAANEKAITEFFTGVSDEIASKLVPGLDRFTKSGESASAALQRLAGEFQATDQVAQLLGKSALAVFGSSGMESATAREQLIDLAGGIQVLGQQATFYAQNFLTEAERLKPVAEALDAELAKLGRSSIKTTEQFKARIDQLVSSGEILTASGAAEFAALMRLEEAFVLVHGAIKDTTTALQEQVQAQRTQASAALDAVDSTFSVLQSVVNREKAALQTRIDAETAVIGKLKSLSDTLHGALDGMRPERQATAERAVAQAQLGTALTIARAGGGLPDADGIKRAIGIASQSDPRRFASYEEYLADFTRTRNLIAELTNLTDDKLSVEEKALDALQEQVKVLDDTLAREQEAVDQLKGINTNGLSTVQAIEALRGAILSALANPVVSATGAISQAYQGALGRMPDASGLSFWQSQAASGVSQQAIVDAIKNSPEAKAQSLYQSLLGRAADASGLQFWTDKIASGVSLSDVTSAIKSSSEYQRLHPFAVGVDYVPETMPALVHEGERIIPAGDNRELMRRLSSPASNNDVLAREIRVLKGALEQQARATGELASHVKRQADVLTSADGGNLLRVRVVGGK